MVKQRHRKNHGSSWYITLKEDYTELDGETEIIGWVVYGLEVMDEIQNQGTKNDRTIEPKNDRTIEPKIPRTIER